MTVNFTFTVTRRAKTDARHEQTVAEYQRRILTLEAELEQARMSASHVVDLAAERARRRPNAGGTSA